MKIVLCADDNYAKHMATTMVSVIANCPVKLEFVILYVSMSSETITQLEQFFESKVASLQFIYVSQDKLNNIPLPDASSYFSISTYLRLFAPAFLPDEESVLYLDSDMIIRDDISKLMNLNIVKELEQPLYAVEEMYTHLKGLENYQLTLGVSLDSPLLNGGLLIFNIKQWLKNDYLGAVLKYIESQKKSPVFVDQDALNAVFNGKWAALPVKWNMGDTQFNAFCRDKFKCYTVEEVESAKDNPSLIHFTWILKPWKYRCKHPYKSEYWKYRKMTPWSERKEEGKTFASIIKKHTPLFVKRTIANFRKGNR